MTIKTFEENGMTVVAPEGKIDHVTVEEFEKTAVEAAQAGSNTLMIDMAGYECRAFDQEPATLLDHIIHIDVHTYLRNRCIIDAFPFFQYWFAGSAEPVISIFIYGRRYSVVTGVGHKGFNRFLCPAYIHQAHIRISQVIGHTIYDILYVNIDVVEILNVGQLHIYEDVIIAIQGITFFLIFSHPGKSGWTFPIR